MEILGIDVGGSGMKGALVNIETGELTTERFRIATPKSKKPEDMAKVVKRITSHFKYEGPVGCGFPTLVHHGVARLHSNLDPEWVGTDIPKLFEKECGMPFVVINDADAAGVAEMEHGAGKDNKGVVIMITIGTGLGSGFFVNGKLVPNFELGRLNYRKKILWEQYAADSIRTTDKLTWVQWAKRFNQYLQHIDMLFSPDLIILGGGASKKMNLFEKHIKLGVNAEVVAAQTQNEAGIIGAAMAAKGLL
ncbi:MAG: ROK family protein [Spirosomaceae bacterium]|nr:ROK family protein [Spirosomataceae bacterium]